ncbi:MAG: BamA/TamA family outer membrane protein, partial [Nannocystaceae bacterium]
MTGADGERDARSDVAGVDEGAAGGATDGGRTRGASQTGGADSEGPDAEHEETEDEVMTRDTTQSRRSRVGKLRRNGHYLILVPSIRVEASFGVEFGTSGRYVYRPPGRNINMVLLSLQNRFSTKMVQEHELSLRLRDLFGKREMFVLDGRFIDDPRFTYAGISNRKGLDNTILEEESFYRVKVRTYGGRVGYQHPLWRSGEALPAWFQASILSVIGTFRFEMDRAKYSEDSLFAEEQGDAATTTRRSSLTAGVVYDARNREVSPDRGSYHELSVEWAAPWLGATQTWGRLNAGARWFIPMGTDRAILAMRVGGDAQFGTPPYFTLGQFGGVDAFDGFGGRMVGRGFYRRRFIGQYKVYTTPEFRFIPLKTL